MMTPQASNNLRNIWRRLSGFDIVALVIFALGAVATITELSGSIANFVKFLAVLCLFYLLFRFIGWWRSRLLWSLRNRLIVAYLFIALVPILLIVTLAALAGILLDTTFLLAAAWCLFLFVFLFLGTKQKPTARCRFWRWVRVSLLNISYIIRGHPPEDT